MASLFYEMLDENVTERLAEFSPRENVKLLPRREELVVDYAALEKAAPPKLRMDQQ